MNILIISPGKKHDATIADGIAEFEKRITRFGFEWLLPQAGTKDAEGEAILKLIKPADVVALLDERGKDIDTPHFAKLLESHEMQGTKRLVFVIGGAFGVADAVTKRANAVIKLSSLVFPHMLVRLILTEQIYRTQTILEGGKYHHS